MLNKFKQVLLWILIINASVCWFIPFIWGAVLGLLSQVIIRHINYNYSEVMLVWALAPFNFLMDNLGEFFIVSLLGISLLIFLGVTGWLGYDNLGMDESGD